MSPNPSVYFRIFLDSPKKGIEFHNTVIYNPQLYPETVFKQKRNKKSFLNVIIVKYVSKEYFGFYFIMRNANKPCVYVLLLLKRYM